VPDPSELDGKPSCAKFWLHQAVEVLSLRCKLHTWQAWSDTALLTNQAWPEASLRGSCVMYAVSPAPHLVLCACDHATAVMSLPTKLLLLQAQNLLES
jgi:hypothetical protein